jgi:hypothetical protein
MVKVSAPVALVVGVVLGSGAVAGAASTGLIAPVRPAGYPGAAAAAPAEMQTVLSSGGRGVVPSTSSTTWGSLRLGGRCQAENNACPTRGFLRVPGRVATVTFSGIFDRAPVELRLRVNGRAKGPVLRFAPRTSSKIVSYTYQLSSDSGCTRSVSMEWRSPTGRKVGNPAATLVAHYGNDQQVEAVDCE